MKSKQVLAFTSPREPLICPRNTGESCLSSKINIILFVLAHFATFDFESVLCVSETV